MYDAFITVETHSGVSCALSELSVQLWETNFRIDIHGLPCNPQAVVLPPYSYSGLF